MSVSFSKSVSDSDEIRSAKFTFCSSLSIIRCFLRSGELFRGSPPTSVTGDGERAPFEEGFPLPGEFVKWLTLSLIVPARSLKGISLTTTMSSSSLLIFPVDAADEPTGSSSSSDEVDISDAGDAERDEGAELLEL